MSNFSFRQSHVLNVLKCRLLKRRQNVSTFPYIFPTLMNHDVIVKSFRAYNKSAAGDFKNVENMTNSVEV